MRRKKKVFKKNQCIDWIFIYVEKSDETDSTVRYKYLIDDDHIDHAGEIEIDKRAVYEIYDTLDEKMDHIKNYFDNGLIKIIKCPEKRVYSNYGMKDFNAVYAASIAVEYKYWTDKFGNSFSRIAQEHFEMYIKNFSNIFHIIDQKDKEISFISYEMEFYKDYWSYMTFNKIYEDDQILRYQYHVDTISQDDYITVEFVKDIQITSFKSYSVLYKRLLNKNVMYAIRNKKTHTYRDFEYERRSSIIIYHILNYQRKNGCYLSDGAIINQRAYDYYDTVTHAIRQFGDFNDNKNETIKK